MGEGHCLTTTWEFIWRMRSSSGEEKKKDERMHLQITLHLPELLRDCF